MDRGTAAKVGVIGALFFTGYSQRFSGTQSRWCSGTAACRWSKSLFYPALYAPWMLKFLWTILVDRFHSEKQGKYRSWIIPLQLVTAGVMAGLAQWQLGAPSVMFVLGVLLINVFSSMQDVSTDGHAITLLRHGERGWGNAIQVGTFWLGYVVGGGLILMLFGTLGWSNLLFAMAVIYILGNHPHRAQSPGPGGIAAAQPRHQAKTWGGIIEFIRLAESAPASSR